MEATLEQLFLFVKQVVRMRSEQFRLAHYGPGPDVQKLRELEQWVDVHAGIFLLCDNAPTQTTDGGQL